MRIKNLQKPVRFLNELVVSVSVRKPLSLETVSSSSLVPHWLVGLPLHPPTTPSPCPSAHSGYLTSPGVTLSLLPAALSLLLFCFFFLLWPLAILGCLCHACSSLLLPTHSFPKHNSSQLQFFVLSWFSVVPCRRRSIPASSLCKGCAMPLLLQCSHHRAMLCCHCRMWEGYMARVIVEGRTRGLPFVMVVCGKCLWGMTFVVGWELRPAIIRLEH